MKESPPLNPSTKPNISRVDGNAITLSASRITKKMLFISIQAVTGPAGPLENASCNKVWPIVSDILPTIPIKNSLPSNGFTDCQYQNMPSNRTIKLVTLLDPKLTVRASKLYFG